MEGLFQYNLINEKLKEIDLDFFKTKFNPSKFVQIYFQEKPVFILGEDAHKRLLESGLKHHEVGIDFFVNYNNMEIPEISKCGIYEMVGAGKVHFLENNFGKFHLGSTDYLIGTNKKHLEKLFGEKIELESYGEYPSYLVNFKE